MGGDGQPPEVCVVRLRIEKYVRTDCNRDLVINFTDVMLVETSPFYSFRPNATSKCPRSGCGSVDINQDGRVDQLDSTAITQSAVLGTNVSCGGVYATAFSCESTRGAPITPAVDISYDTVVYFSDDGLIVEGIELEHAFSRRVARDPMMDTLLMEVQQLKEENKQLQEKDQQLEDTTKQLLNNVMRHDEQLRGSSQRTTPSLAVELLLSAVAVVACAGVVAVVYRRRPE